jgi:glyoxylase-like metal-dependent hydrolase (beta-lactamase superfamily II)
VNKDPQIHTLPIEIPWPVGPINVLLIEDDPLTLVDTGPNFASTLEALRLAVAEHGHRLEDIQRVLLTHQHIDHMGLASEIVRRSGAEVWALDLLAGWLADQPAKVAADRAYMSGLLSHHGVPRRIVASPRTDQVAKPGWDPSVTVTHELHDGDIVPFSNREWRVMTRPGHSPFDTIFVDEKRGLLVAGDHLLPAISSNPVITPIDPGTADSSSFDQRPRAMLTYRESLEKTRMLDVNTILPGHGEGFSDHVALIDKRFTEMDVRTEQVAAILAGGPRTAHEVATELFGRASQTQPELTMSEVLGHADVLREAGRLLENELDDVVQLELLAA